MRPPKFAPEFAPEFAPDGAPDGAPDVPADAWSILGQPIWVTLPASRTGGRLTVLEHIAAPGQGPPLHVHAREDEALHLLSGRLRALVGDRMTEAGPGDSIFLPRGVPHAWSCVGPAPARMLVVLSPSGFEEFFRLCHEQHLALPRDAARMATLARRFRCRFLGPPLG